MLHAHQVALLVPPDEPECTATHGNDDTGRDRNDPNETFVPIAPSRPLEVFGDPPKTSADGRADTVSNRDRERADRRLDHPFPRQQRRCQRPPPEHDPSDHAEGRRRGEHEGTE